MAALGAPEECCVTCCNATSGLSAALLATGRTGQVLVPSFTFPASLGAVRAAGMTPVVVDVDALDWTLGGHLLDAALAKTGARLVMLVAPFGIAQDWDASLAVCRTHGAAVVIDNASGLGAPRPQQDRGEDVFEVFSMHATKPFGVGEGGVVFAHRVHEKALRSILNFALDSHAAPEGPLWGFNGKMSEFHAAVGIVQESRFSDRLKRRQAFVALYRDRLAAYPEIALHQDVGSAPWQCFPVLLPTAATAERFIDHAFRAGVEIRRNYSPSLSLWPATRCFQACPVAEDLADRMCVLPVRALDLDNEPETTEIVDLVFDALDRV